MRSKIIAIAFFLPLFFILGGIIIFLLLPFIANSYLLPHLLVEMPFDQRKVSISRLTPWSARGTLALGSGDQESVSVARYEADYSPHSLLQGRISSLLLDSTVIHLQVEDGKPLLRGLRQRSEPSPQKTEISLPVMPLKIDRIEIQNAQVAVHIPDDKSQFINLDAELMPTYRDVPDGGYELRDLKLDFTTRGALKLSGELEIQAEAEDHRLTIRTEQANVREVVTSLNVLPGWQVAGKFIVNGNVLIEGLQNIGDFSITAKTADFNVHGKGVEVGVAGTDKWATFELNGDLQQVKYVLSGLEVKSPEPVLFEADGRYDIGLSELQGNFQLFPGRMNASLSGNYQGKVGSRIALSYTMEGEPFSLENGIEGSNYSAKGTLNYGDGSFSGNLQAAVSAVAWPEKEISMHGISVDLPYNYPPLAPGVIVPGNLFVEEIRYRNEHIATLKGGLSLAPERIALNTQTTTPLHESFRLVCSSSWRFRGDGDLQCSLPQIEVDASHVPEVVSLPDGLTFNGKIAAEARYGITDGVHKGDATILPSDIQVKYGDYTFSGINGSLKFPRLPTIQSSPSQLFTIDTMNLGKLRMSDAKIFLRVDDSETLFVEEARLRWCGGRVEAGALKVYKNMEKLETRLYCDRLSYIELLDQFGVGNAEGGGSLNGRLPIVISREGVEFDDGFLFSTPGESGIVKFSSTQKLRQGMAAMNKTSYLDYSMDALENFAYNWTKLTFDTEGEELLLTLQLDGKPAQPLPYGYRKGQIVKTTEGQGIQHPLRLDVNFRLPMRDLLRYGKSIQSLMENM